MPVSGHVFKLRPEIVAFNILKYAVEIVIVTIIVVTIIIVKKARGKNSKGKKEDKYRRD